MEVLWVFNSFKLFLTFLVLGNKIFKQPYTTVILILRTNVMHTSTSVKHMITARVGHTRRVKIHPVATSVCAALVTELFIHNVSVSR